MKIVTKENKSNNLNPELCTTCIYFFSNSNKSRKYDKLCPCTVSISNSVLHAPKHKPPYTIRATLIDWRIRCPPMNTFCFPFLYFYSQRILCVFVGPILPQNNNINISKHKPSIEYYTVRNPSGKTTKSCSWNNFCS